MNNSANETLKEMLTGIVLYGIVVQLICLCVTTHRGYVSAGLWIGIFTGIGIAIHMKRSIEDALDLGEGNAEKHMKKTYAFRYAVTALVFGTAIYFHIGNPIAILAGVIGLKISAYLQPYTHKIFLKIKKSK